MRRDVASRRARRLDATRTGTSRINLSSPALSAGVLSYLAYRRAGDSYDAELHRRDLRSGRRAAVRCAPRDTRWVAAGGAGLLLLAGPDPEAPFDRPAYAVTRTSAEELPRCGP